MDIFLVDVDNVVLDLHVEWLKRYNRDYNDTLTVDRLLAWDMTKFVKPECGNKIYNYLLDTDLYDNVPEIEGSKEGVDFLREIGFKVIFLTAGINYSKYARLKKLGFLSSEKEIVFASDKSLVVGDFLIDDYDVNINSFSSTNKDGKAYLLDAPWNRHKGTDDMNRVYIWQDIISKFTNGGV